MAQSESNRMKLRISGRVQGVGFRWFVVAQARRLVLRGWVRNTPDGSVELEAEGPPSALADLRKRVSRGPSAAHVEHVNDLPVGSDPLPSRFEITS